MDAPDAERRAIAVAYYDNISRVRRGQAFTSVLLIGLVWWFFGGWWPVVPALLVPLALIDSSRAAAKRERLRAGIDPVPADIPGPGGRKPVRYIP